MARIVLLVNDGEDDGAYIDVGIPLDEIEAEFTARLGGKTKDDEEDFLNSINRRDMARHIDDLACRRYCEQFERRSLLAEIGHYVANISDVGETLTFEVKQISDEEWADACRRGEEMA